MFNPPPSNASFSNPRSSVNLAPINQTRDQRSGTRDFLNQIYATNPMSTVAGAPVQNHPNDLSGTSDSAVPRVGVSFSSDPHRLSSGMNSAAPNPPAVNPPDPHRLSSGMNSAAPNPPAVNSSDPHRLTSVLNPSHDPRRNTNGTERQSHLDSDRLPEELRKLKSEGPVEAHWICEIIASSFYIECDRGVFVTIELVRSGLDSKCLYTCLEGKLNLTSANHIQSQTALAGTSGPPNFFTFNQPINLHFLLSDISDPSDHLLLLLKFWARPSMTIDSAIFIGMSKIPLLTNIDASSGNRNSVCEYDILGQKPRSLKNALRSLFFGGDSEYIVGVGDAVENVALVRERDSSSLSFDVQVGKVVADIKTILKLSG